MAGASRKSAMRHAPIWLAVAALLALSSGAGAAQEYKTARSLFEDCAATAALKSGAQSEPRERCADYLDRVFNAWNLNQDNGVCSRHVGAQLPDAYVKYWRNRGLGFLSGEFRSAEASVNDFLDSQKQPCPPMPP
jgi:uncharacterized membrane protein